MSTQFVILVVDDNPDNRALFAHILKKAGHRVLEAEDGDEALIMTRREQPDLVITDLAMPKMDGARYIEELRRDPNPAIAQTPVVIATTNEQAVELARKHHIQSVIPFTAEPLVILGVVEATLPESPCSSSAPSSRGERLENILTELKELAAKAWGKS